MRIIILIFLISLASCTSSLSYNRQYIGSIQPIPGSQIDGAAAILTSGSQDAYVFAGGPTSFTGGGSSIELPLGVIVKEVARNTFDRMFSDGVFTTTDRSQTDQYRILITPAVTEFSYAYNQLKNAGFAVTPQVEVTLQIEVFAPSGEVLNSRTFVSGTRDGDSYMLAGDAPERINKLAHETITDLMNQAAMDIYYLIGNEQS